LSHPYEGLTPDLILDAVDSVGLPPDGHLLKLNSYENRVFQIGIDDAPPIVGKFYRPGRWSDAQIQEEHDFAQTLAEADIPVVAPWRDAQRRSLFLHQGYRFALFPRRGGRAPEPGDLDQLEWIGRFIGRIHLTGQSQVFIHRPMLEPDSLGWQAREQVLRSPLLPSHEADGYAEASARLIEGIEQALAEVAAETIRLHGDCHHGNILWTDEGPHFVDLDDCRNGPAVQDLWMLLNGDRQERTVQLSAMLEGYTLFRDFNPRELALVEPLRGLRMLHYNAWVASRWDDPAFPAAFHWAESPHHWAQHVHDLRAQLELLQEPPLRLF
jgi:Ser/Thr protein kinase RdoA (MazF antagonist)